MLRRSFLGLAAQGAVLAPVALRAQPSRPIVATLSTRAATDSALLFAAFRKGLATLVNEGGFVVESRWANGDYAALKDLAAEIVALKPAVILAVGGEPAALAARAATSTIPIVFGVGADPVKLGLVRSLSNPGGNATGVNLFLSETEAKRVGVLRDLLPGSRTIAALVNPRFPRLASLEEDMRRGLAPAGQTLVTVAAGDDGELAAALASLGRLRPDGLVVAGDPFFDARRAAIIAAVARERIPAIYQTREWPAAGGLVSYGIDLADIYRQFGVYVGRILRGVGPGDLPVVQPVKIELVLNLKAAGELGLTVPPLVFAQADEIIE